MTKNTKKQNGRNVTEEFRRAAAKRVYNNQKSKAGVARELGIPESTLRGWCNKYKKEIESEGQMEIPTEPIAKRPKIEHNKDRGMEGIKGELPQLCNQQPKAHVYAESLLDLSQNFTNGSIKSASEELARVGREFGLNQPEIFNNSNINFASIHQIYEIITSQPKTLEEERLRNYIIYWLAMQQQQTVNLPKERKSPNGLSSQRNSNETPTAKPRPQYKPVPSTSSINGFSATVTHTDIPEATTPINTIPTKSTPLNYANPTLPTATGIPTTPVEVSPKETSIETPLESPPPPQTFWKSYKKATKDTIVTERAESVLRNLLRGGNTETGNDSVMCTPYTEVMKSGEQFLTWMMSPENPLVTASERMMMMGMLERVKNAEDRRKGVLENDAKAGRKSYVPIKILRAV